jgi:hypothetical protein
MIAPPASSEAIAGVSWVLGMVQTAIPPLTQSARAAAAAAIMATAKSMKTILPFLIIARPPMCKNRARGKILERILSRATRRQKK